MPQIQTGTVTGAQGFSTFEGDIDTDWSGVSPGTCWIGLKNSDFNYQVATVTNPTASSSGFWELTITGVISDADFSGALYGIQKDFTANLGLAINVNGDYQIPLYMARNALILDRFGLSTPYTASQDEGFVNLTTSQTVVNITFNVTLGSASFFPVIEIINTSADANKDDIRYQVRGRTTSGMTVFLFNPPPTNNYVLLWKVGGPQALPGGEQIISDVTLSADATSHTIASIPQIFTHLRLAALTKAASASISALRISFNSDVNPANYVTQLTRGTAATLTTQTIVSYTGIRIGTANGDDVGGTNFASCNCLLPFYRVAAYKMSQSRSSHDAISSIAQETIDAKWFSNAAIDNIVVFSGADLRAGSRIVLLGIL